MKKNLKDLWYKIKTAEGGKLVLITTAIILLLFSGFLFIKINISNSWINRVCEPRQYTDWSKEILAPLDSNRRQEIINEIQREKNSSTENNIFNKYIRLFSPEERIKNLENTLKKGEEIKTVPDEERRTLSRKEVENYKNCLKNQNFSKLDRPQKYNFLIIGNLVILTIGLLLSFALNKEKAE